MLLYGSAELDQVSELCTDLVCRGYNQSGFYGFNLLARFKICSEVSCQGTLVERPKDYKGSKGTKCNPKVSSGSSAQVQVKSGGALQYLDPIVESNRLGPHLLEVTYAALNENDVLCGEDRSVRLFL